LAYTRRSTAVLTLSRHFCSSVRTFVVRCSNSADSHECAVKSRP